MNNIKNENSNKKQKKIKYCFTGEKLGSKKKTKMKTGFVNCSPESVSRSSILTNFN